MKIPDLLVVRLLLVGLLAFKAFDAFFASVLTFAYRMNVPAATEGMGRLTPGDDYNRLIPLMEAVPLWLHGLWVLAGILYLIAITLVVRSKGWAHIPILAAFGIEIVARFVGQPVIESTGVVVNPNPSLVASLIIPYVLPLALILVLWRWTPTLRPTPR
jgi:hypothetical protein